METDHPTKLTRHEVALQAREEEVEQRERDITQREHEHAGLERQRQMELAGIRQYRACLSYFACEPRCKGQN